MRRLLVLVAVLPCPVAALATPPTPSGLALTSERLPPQRRN
jgi:hypothetical protein